MYMYMKIFANHQHIYRKKKIQIYSDIAKNKHGHSVFGVDDMGSIISSLFCLQVCQISAQKEAREDLIQRFTSIEDRLNSLKVENDEVR